MFVPLKVEERSYEKPPRVITVTLARRKRAFQKEMYFIAASREAMEYTVEIFSTTRFGSHRSRPDHDMMKRIQRQAAIEAISS